MRRYILNDALVAALIHAAGSAVGATESPRKRLKSHADEDVPTTESRLRTFSLDQRREDWKNQQRMHNRKGRKR